MDQGLKLLSNDSKTKIRLQKKKYDGMKRIGLKVLDCSLTLYNLPNVYDAK